MDAVPRGQSRRPFAIAVVILVILLLIVSAFAVISHQSTPTPSPHGRVDVCAVDPMYARNPAGSANPTAAYCVQGDFQAQNGKQVVLAHAFDESGHALPNAKISFTVSGANNANGTVTSVNGVADFSYTGAHAGDDTIGATLAGGTQTAQSKTATVRWITPQKYIRPIIFVHGVNEDASDYEVQIDDSFIDKDAAGGGDKGKQVFTALIDALKLKYDPQHMEAFCYVDDRAYVSNLSACNQPDPPQCSGATCVSQSSVDLNGVALGQVILSLHQAAQTALAANPATPGTDKVTIIAYSMGAAVTRSFLSGCNYELQTNPSNVEAAQCPTAVSQVDHVFFVDGAQQGSWLLEANKALTATTAFGASLPGNPNPFASVLNTIQQTIYAKFQQLSQGLDANQRGVQNLTPGSETIQGYLNVAIPSNVAVYNFYSDVQLRLGVSVLNWQLAGQTPLNLGDFIMLAQDDPAQVPLAWGGAGLCDSCAPTQSFGLQASLAPYMAARASSTQQYHAWTLNDPHTLDVNALAPNLTIASAQSAFGGVFNSPVWHLNTTQPETMAPGSAVQVQDVTGRTTHTDIPTEILYVLAHDDNLTLP